MTEREDCEKSAKRRSRMISLFAGFGRRGIHYLLAHCLNILSPLSLTQDDASKMFGFKVYSKYCVFNIFQDKHCSH